MKRLAIGCVLASLMLLVFSASAPGAVTVRHAAPGAGGLAPCTDASAPCSIATAVAAALANDEVVLEPGSYSDTAGDLGAAGSVSLPPSINVRGALGEPRPVITLADPTKSGGAFTLNGSDLVSHLEIDNTAR